MLYTLPENRQREHTHAASTEAGETQCLPRNGHSRRKGELQLSSSECSCQNLKPNIEGLKTKSFIKERK